MSGFKKIKIITQWRITSVSITHVLGTKQKLKYLHSDMSRQRLDGVNGVLWKILYYRGVLWRISFIGLESKKKFYRGKPELAQITGDKDIFNPNFYTELKERNKILVIKRSWNLNVEITNLQ